MSGTACARGRGSCCALMPLSAAATATATATAAGAGAAAALSPPPRCPLPAARAGGGALSRRLIDLYFTLFKMILDGKIGTAATVSRTISTVLCTGFVDLWGRMRARPVLCVAPPRESQRCMSERFMSDCGELEDCTRLATVSEVLARPLEQHCSQSSPTHPSSIIATATAHHPPTRSRTPHAWSLCIFGLSFGLAACPLRVCSSWSRAFWPLEWSAGWPAVHSVQSTQA